MGSLFEGKRWDKDGRRHSLNQPVDLFLADVLAVCKRHNMSISHEDRHGGFIVEPYSAYNASWLFEAAFSKKNEAPIGPEPE